jgi:hypothetical protein
MSNLILRLLIETVSASTLSLLVIFVVAWFCRHWIVAKLSASTRHQYDVRIADLKSQLESESEQKILEIKTRLDRQTSQLSTALSLFSATQSAVVDRRITAIDELWREVVETRNCAAMAMRMADCLLPHEFNQAIKKNPLFFDGLAPEALKKELTKTEGSSESCRPYVEPYLWFMVWSYKAVHLRARLLLSQTMSGTTSEIWYQDEATLSLVKAMLTDQEFQRFSSEEYEKLKLLEHLIEPKILRSIDRVLSGAKQSDDLLNQSIVLDEKLTALKKDVGQ